MPVDNPNPTIVHASVPTTAPAASLLPPSLSAPRPFCPYLTSPSSSSCPPLPPTVRLALPAEALPLEKREDGQMTPEEVYDIVATILDPEHPLTLSQLGVVNLPDITVTPSQITVHLTPTIPHCSMSTLIGLCIHTKLTRSVSRRYRVKVGVKEGTHQQWRQVSRQLQDKERVWAAMENGYLRGVVEKCLVEPA